jgi:hypothetical protein
MGRESDTPLEQRSLMLVARYSSKRFENWKSETIAWSHAHGDRLAPSNNEALVALERFSMTANTRALAVRLCYADVPPFRSYDLAFNARSFATARARADLLFGLIGGPAQSLPVLGLEAGYNHMAVFSFPQGVPELVDALPEYPREAEGPRDYVALCDSSNWDQIKEHLQVLFRSFGV